MMMMINLHLDSVLMKYGIKYTSSFVSSSDTKDTKGMSTVIDSMRNGHLAFLKCQ